MKRYGVRVRPNDSGASEVLDETMIIALGIVCAVVTIMLVFGALPSLQKTAYVVPQFGIKNISGGSVIYLFHRGGDPVYFDTAPIGNSRAALIVDTSAGSFTAVPVSGLGVFRPGDLVYLYYTGSGFVITRDLTGVPIVKLPSGQVSVSMVDVSSGVLISQDIVVKGATTASPTATATATPTTTTTTATPVPATLAANFNWVEFGAGGAVHFTDTSTGSPTSWSWNLCGSSSTARNPVKNFGKGASCAVMLTVTRSSDGATSSISKTITTV
jgi:PKD repeat protein